MTVSGNLGARVDLVVDAVPCALVVLERDGSIGNCNAAARHLFGVDASPSSATDLFNPDGAGDLHGRLRAGERPSVVTRVTRSDGSMIDVQIDAEPVFDESGDYLGAVCSLRDVTTELAAAAELHERQRLMERLSLAVRDINADLDLQAVFDRVCESAASLVKACGSGLAIVEGEEAVCVAEWNAGPALVGARWRADGGLIDEARRTGEPAQAGNIHAFAPSAARLPELAGMRTVFCVPTIHNGRSIGALYLLFEEEDLRLSLNELDVLELLAAHAGAAFENAREHAEVVKAQARQQAVVDATADGMALLDAAGNITSWNAAAESLTGVPEHEAIGAPPPFFVDLGRGAVAHQLPTGRWLEIIASAVAGTGERVLDFRDITAAKRLDEARDLFLATTSHELRTPITVVKGFAGTLLHRWDELTDVERREAVSTIVHRTESLAALVDQLLLGSTTDAGFQLDTTAFDIGVALRGALAGFEALSDGHTLVLQVPAGLPKVAGDRGSLDNVVAQLIENAVRYSPDGGEVRVVASREGDHIVVSVSDDGIGISDDDAQLIFERSYQAGAGDSRPFGGLGLGLYIVRRLIEAQEGRVRAYGTVGAGATVEFTLPVAADRVPLYVPPARAVR
ncbi:MAG: ATP-binding protein [Actinomycetota bacterium]